jgi:formyltetrahydrofolate hydrolase
LREREFVLTLSCRDTMGIVHAVSGLLFQAGCNIIDSQQFGDLEGDDATGLFFMRVHFQAPPQLANAPALIDVVTTQDALSSDAGTGLGWVPDRQALTAWDEAERQRRA